MASYTVVPEPLRLDGGAGAVEALLEIPAEVTAPRAVAVCCHPHPLYGGALTNKVIHTVARAFVAAGVPALQGAAQESEAIARVHDLRFALSEALGGEFGALLDGQRVVAAGHSYGANTTLLASGAQVVRGGRPLDLRDPRIRAAIVISAPPFYGESALASILGPVRVPSLHVSATEDIIRIPGYYSGPEDRVAVFDAIGSPRKTLALFTGGSHSMFTDRAGTGGLVLNGQVKTATKELGTAFLRQVLEGDETALGTWPQRHAAIVAKFVTAG
jgi:hypothetical protein